MSHLKDYKHPRLTNAALEYAEIGLRVIPLEGKTPFMERWPERGTCCPDQIVSWFESWPDKNIGVLTGGGLVVVDVDPKNGGRRSFRKLIQGKRWPITAKALTGSGGHHYLFRVDTSLRIGNVNGLLPGIDIKGEGGQFAVEPSVHPRTGKEYVWLRTPQQGIAEAPAWLVRRLTVRRSVAPRTGKPVSSTRDGDVGHELAVAIERFPVTGCGQRNHLMVRLVGSLFGRDYRADFIQAVVGAWWGHFHDKGVIGTHPSEAPRAVGACIRSMSRSETFKMAVGTDHRADWTR